MALSVPERLTSVSARAGLAELAQRIQDSGTVAGGDLAGVEDVLRTVGSDDTAVAASAKHLLSLPGKRLRPLCVALAARMGSGFDAAARELAVAVELVHAATLLHDDVVDVADVRRGAPAARVVYGNAASIFAGDWLLVEALRRVDKSGVPGASARLLAVIDEMIQAESLQLDRRGRLDPDRDVYWRVVEGKTAALFRWALYAGARAGGLSAAVTEALETFGLHLGTAFQIIDDVLDVSGDAARLGKALFADLREGKMTLPLLLAVERDPSLRAIVEDVLALPADEPIPARWLERASAILKLTGAVPRARELAADRVAKARAQLAGIPPSPVSHVLATVADATLTRES